MLSEASFDAIIETLYEAALDPKQWATVIEMTTRGFEAVGASIFTPFVPKLGLEPIWSTNADAEFIAAYASEWGQTDPFLAPLWRRMPAPNLLYCWDDLISRKEYEAWAGYPGMLRQGARQGTGLMVNTEDHRAGQLMVYTWDIEGPHIDGIKHDLKRIERHFHRALRVHWHLDEARRKADAAAITLDMFRTGAAWLSAAGEVLYTNQEMDSVIAKGDGIHLVNGMLGFRDPQAKAALAVAIKEAIAERSGGLMAERPSGAAPYRINVVPLPVHANALRLPNAAAIAFVSEAVAPTEASVAAATRIYGFSPAEARATALLVAGLDTQQIADKLGSSINTVRTQVKSILAKAGIARQADLIRLVATIPQVERP